MNVRHFWTKFLGLVSNLLVFLLFGYILFVLGRSVWQNYQTTMKIKQLQNEISQLEGEKERLTNLIIYEQTDSFKELEARKRLGVKRPAEKVMIVSTQPIAEQKTTSPNFELGTGNLKDEVPNYTRWLQFIYGE